jgi:phosphonate transport system substrate-binding protein
MYTPLPSSPNVAFHRSPSCLFLLVLLLLSILGDPWCGSSCAGQSAPIRFSPLPMENRETTVLQFRPMIEYLEQQLHRQVVFDFSDDYATILDKFLANRIDLIYLGPLPYIELRAQASHAEPLVHFREDSGEAKYACAIVTLADRPIQLKGLSNHRFALTQPLSTCGYLSVNGLLMEHDSSLTNNRYRYLGKHDAVALAVVRGEFDAGGLKSAIADRYTHLGLKIIAQTASFPGFALIGNQTSLSAETRKTISKALIRLDPKGADRKLLSHWGSAIRHGAIPATDADYTTIRRYKGSQNIPIANKE